MFIDDVINKSDYINPQSLLFNYLRQAQIFKINNVAKYVLEIDESADLVYTEDIISFNAPYDICWFEFRLPCNLKFKKDVVANKFCNKNIGILQIKKEQTSPKIPEMTHMIMQYVFSDMFNIRRSYICRRDIFTNKQGTYLNHKHPDSGMPTGITNGNGTTIQKDIIPHSFSRNLVEKIGREEIYMLINLFGFLSLDWALNFLHFKNSIHQENIIPKKVIKQRNKKNKPYFEKFYTLEIDALRRILDMHGKATKKGLKYALHTCRGHFRTYTVDRPPFGDPTKAGTYWIDAHFRGNKNVGKIHKDYEVKVKGDS